MTRAFLSATAFAAMCAVTLAGVAGAANSDAPAASASAPTVQVYSNPG